MKIFYDLSVDKYIITNHGKTIATYQTYEEFRHAKHTLDRLQAMLERPEAFCDCCDIYSKESRR